MMNLRAHISNRKKIVCYVLLYYSLSLLLYTKYYYTHILASEKTWGDLLDILRSYIFHSGNSYPKFLTKKFSAALYFSFGKNEDSTMRMLYFHIGTMAGIIYK